MKYKYGYLVMKYVCYLWGGCGWVGGAHASHTSGLSYVICSLLKISGGLMN